MTIRKGEPWGAPYEVTGAEPPAENDAMVAELGRDAQVAVIRATGGDLHRSLGGRPSESPHRLPIDLLEVVADESTWWAAAHVVVRGRWWSGHCVVAMNATHLGEWLVGPRAHPNDGLVDVTEGELGLRDRLTARRRAVTGSHLPHPALSQVRTGEYSTTFDRPRPLFVDGVRRGSTTRLTIRVVPDATSVVL